jgi:menaquinone-dependent protoporphyrinogen oxidase
MTSVLVVYHSYDGQTELVADRIATGLRTRGCDVDGYEVASAPSPEGYDAVVVGGAIRLGRHARALVRYLRANRALLAERPVMVFHVSMTAVRDDDEHQRIADGFTRSLVRRTGVEPTLVANIAGTLRYTAYGWVTKRVMRSIARREGNSTDTTSDHEYTSWEAVDRFVGMITARLDPSNASRHQRL